MSRPERMSRNGKSQKKRRRVITGEFEAMGIIKNALSREPQKPKESTPNKRYNGRPSLFPPPPRTPRTPVQRLTLLASKPSPHNQPILPIASPHKQLLMLANCLPMSPTIDAIPDTMRDAPVGPQSFWPPNPSPSHPEMESPPKLGDRFSRISIPASPLQLADISFDQGSPSRSFSGSASNDFLQMDLSREFNRLREQTPSISYISDVVLDSESTTVDVSHILTSDLSYSQARLKPQETDLNASLLSSTNQVINDQINVTGISQDLSEFDLENLSTKQFELSQDMIAPELIEKVIPESLTGPLPKEPDVEQPEEAIPESLTEEITSEFPNVRAPEFLTEEISSELPTEEIASELPTEEIASELPTEEIASNSLMEEKTLELLERADPEFLEEATLESVKEKASPEPIEQETVSEPLFEEAIPELSVQNEAQEFFTTGLEQTGIITVEEGQVDFFPEEPTGQFIALDHHLGELSLEEIAEREAFGDFDPLGLELSNLPKLRATFPGKRINPLKSSFSILGLKYGRSGLGITEKGKSNRSTARRLKSSSGVEVPSLPDSLIKGMSELCLQGRNGGPRLSSEALPALQRATFLYFQQTAHQLAAYAKHAGRITIDASDAKLLMKRQGIINDRNNTLTVLRASLPQEYVDLTEFAPMARKK